MRNLLFEIGIEELPSGYIRPALAQLKSGLRRLLEENRIGVDTISTAGTPRRLTVHACGVSEKQAARSREVIGPPVHVAYDEENNPTGAATGFARSQGIKTESLSVKDTPKGQYLAAVIEDEGKPAAELLPSLLAVLTGEINFPKTMRWPFPNGEGDCGIQTFQFARPVRRLLALFGREVIPVSVAGLEAGRFTRGHPFLSPGEIRIENASLQNYSEKLKAAFVVVDCEERREIIEQQMLAMESKNEKVDMQDALLEEVAGIVEHPCCLQGGFDEGFLQIPDCVLVAAMTQHQRYFPVRDARGRLLNRFIVVTNRTKHQADTVREGNERVIGARLADARFFWDDDLKMPLQDRVEMLEDVAYLEGLGNNLHRTHRIVELARKTASGIGIDGKALEHVRDAAFLCKADLITGLVGEFPSLQGKVGSELALAGGRPRPVAMAIGEHYLPDSANGALPGSKVGTAVSLADKIDGIISCYAIGHRPGGSRDPFAMRRNAIGILRMLEENKLDLRLCDLLGSAVDTLREQAGSLGNRELEPNVDEALNFFRERLYHEALERNFRHDIIRAVLAVGFDHNATDERLNGNVNLFWNRLEALHACSARKWWPLLVEVVDRTYRIQKDLNTLPEIDSSKLVEDEEKTLLKLLEANYDDIKSLFQKNEFLAGAEKYCRAFAGPVHRFFEEVFVNVEDDALRLNRKALCGHIYRLFAGYMADLHIIESANDGSGGQ